MKIPAAVHAGHPGDGCAYGIRHRAPLEHANPVVQRRGDAARILKVANAGIKQDAIFAAGHLAGVVDASARAQSDAVAIGRSDDAGVGDGNGRAPDGPVT